MTICCSFNNTRCAVALVQLLTAAAAAVHQMLKQTAALLM
jgi:hypothetical protein